MKFRIKWLFVILCAVVFTTCTKERILVECSGVFNDWNITSIENPAKSYQNAICFPTNEVGYIIGNKGSIIKTVDAGKSWLLISTGNLPDPASKSALSSISFVNENIGYIGVQSNPAVLIKTIDGGQTWTKIDSDKFIYFNKIKFSNENEGLALIIKYVDSHPKEVLMSTVDGGKQWVDVPIPFKTFDFYNLLESNTFIGVVGSDEDYRGFIYRSKDAGKTWETKWLPGTGRNVYFIDENVGFCGDWIYSSPERKYKTMDGGITWNPTSSPYGIFSAIHFKNVNEGFIINAIYEFGEPSGGELTEVIKSYEISQTLDGGLSWVKTEIDKSCVYYDDVFKSVANSFYSVVGSEVDGGGRIYKFEGK